MKDNLRARIKAWLARIDALSLRERLSIFLAAVASLGSILVFGIILPSSDETKRLREDVAQLQKQIQALQAQSAQTPALDDPTTESAAEHSRYDARRTQPQNITTTLRQLVEAQAGVRLRVLDLLPAQPLLGTAAAGDAQPTLAPAEPQVSPVASQDKAGVATGQTTEGRQARDGAVHAWYTHGISMQLEGGYAALTQAVQSLERLPWLVEWRSVRLEATAHPLIRMQVELAVISELPAWTNR